MPASTDGAARFSASSSGRSFNSVSQSQFPSAPPAPASPPVNHSQPRPTGGATVRMVSNPESDSASASSWHCRRTRCWVARVPFRSAK